MRIVQGVGWYYPDSVGGTEVYVAALARHFRGCGHEVTIVAPDPTATTSRTYQHDGCAVFRYPISAAATRDEVQGRVPAHGAEQLHRWLARARPDFVHLHTFVTGLGLHEVVAAKDAGARVVVTTHASSLGYVCQRGTLMWHGRSLCDGIVERRRCAECELEHRGAHPALAALAAQMPEAISRVGRLVPGRVGTAIGMSALIDHNRQRQHDLMRAVDRFVVLTRRAAAIVVANGAPPEKIAVNPLGISQIVAWPPPAPPSRRGPHVRIGWVGRFDPVKGVCDLVEAIRRLPHDAPLRFELRGLAQTATDRRTLDALRTALAGDARVRFADPVSTASIPGVMRSYDVLCCPSRCLEGGPTVGLEAIAVGTPVIAADAGGLAEVLVDGVNGRLVPPGDVGALTAALQEVARSPAATLDRWRTALPRPRTMHEVAADYLTLYARVN